MGVSAPRVGWKGVLRKKDPPSPALVLFSHRQAWKQQHLRCGLQGFQRINLSQWRGKLRQGPGHGEDLSLHRGIPPPYRPLSPDPKVSAPQPLPTPPPTPRRTHARLQAGVSPGWGRGRGRGIPAPYLERNPPAFAAAQRRAEPRSLRNAPEAPLRLRPGGWGSSGEARGPSGTYLERSWHRHGPLCSSGCPPHPLQTPLHLRCGGSSLSLSTFHSPHAPLSASTGFFISLPGWWFVSASCALYSQNSPLLLSRRSFVSLFPWPYLLPLPFFSFQHR